MDNRKFVTENRDFLIKQSEMLQAIISRMASNSLIIKQLGLTLWTTLVGFGFTNRAKPLFVLALISFALLGFLDGYYLHLEKRFRHNFNRLAEILCGFNSGRLEEIHNFRGNFIALEQLSKKQIFQSYVSTLVSWANLPYLIILVTTLIILMAA
ncbi:hypothetical protein ACKFKG_32815 [Phormidesmis sp. 146-35]